MIPARRSHAPRGCVLALALLTIPSGAMAQAPVGIYSDVQGNACSLSDPSPGFINAYVVVRPGPNGVSGVQFAAPKPACFSASYLGDQAVAGTLVGGNSQGGVSVVLPQCTTNPVHVLTIQYYGYGTTPACCEYPVIAAPVPGQIDVVDCNFATTAGMGVVSTINADASCACTGNSPPWPPHSPEPQDGEPAAAVTPLLGWSTTDVDGNLAEFDLYLGTDSDPPLLAASLAQPEYHAGPLLPFTQYFWRVVARDEPGLETSSPLWTFTTRATNTPPVAPGLPSPADGSVDQPVDEPLAWRCSDIDGDTLRYDVYFGASSPPPLVAVDDLASSYFPGTLQFTTSYYWRVVARDREGAETPGPEWSFVTRPANFPPIVPTGPSPWNGAPDQPRVVALQWWCTDADGHAITYDIYFGDSAPPPLLTADWATRYYSPDTLQFTTQYFWKVVARDELGAETAGPLWTFTVKANSPPQLPASPTPANNSSNRPINQSLGWVCTDVDGHAITYDVYFGTASPPPLAALDVPVNAWLPGTLEHATSYYWQIVARDELGAERPGAVWKFTTGPVSQPPNPPSNPNPPNGFNGRPVVQLLSWQCTDPDGDPVKFDVYFGAVSPPPLLASNVSTKSFLPETLEFSTTYYWRILARDVWGVEQTGPEWSFSTRPENYPPSTPWNPNPRNYAVNVNPYYALAWSCSDADGDALVYDVYFGTDQPPPLVASDVPVRVYQLDTLEVGTHYYWRILARDTKGAETSSEVWNFTTRPNLPPAKPAMPFPPDGAFAPLDPTLSWVSGDPEGKPVTYDVYFAAQFPPTLVASGLSTPGYQPGTLDAATTYHWFVVASDGSALSVGPMWSFTASLSGDVNQDGVVSLPDASCALRAFVQQTACAPGGLGFGDVDCSGELTPGDALCIHRSIDDGSCPFCGVVSQSPADAELSPVVSAGAVWQIQDTLVVDLRVAGVPSLHAFGFVAEFAPAVQLIDIQPATPAVWTDFVSAAFTGAGIAGGYSLGGTAADTPARFMRLRFVIPSGVQVIYVDGYTDDLDGAERLAIVWNGTPSGVHAMPGETMLGQNHPNPFNPTTIIPYQLPDGSRPVRLSIFDLSGKRVRTLVDEPQAGGVHEAVWDGKDDRGGPVSSGVYFYVLDADGKRNTRKLVLLK